MRYTLKILSGKLFGVDISLPEGNSWLLFIGNDEELFSDNNKNLLINAENLVYIPSFSAPHRKMLVTVIDDEQGLSLSGQWILSEEEASADKHASSDSLSIPLNQPVSFEQDLHFAIKLQTDSWDDSVTNFSNSTTQQDNDLPQSRSQVEKKKIRRPLLIFGSILAITAGGFFAAYALMPEKLTTMSAVLNNVPLVVVDSTSKPQQFYVFTLSESNSVWAERALQKNALMSDRVHITTLDSETQRVKKILRSMNIAFFKIQLDNPRIPVILLSQERNLPIEGKLSEIKKSLMVTLPYARDIKFQYLSDSDVIQRAKALLGSLNLYFREERSARSTSYIIRGDISDNQLSKLSSLVKDFYVQYGDEYVRFIVNLNEDPLANHSFKLGPNSYIVEPGKHWLYTDIEPGKQ